MRLFPETFDTADKVQIIISYILRVSLLIAAIEAIINMEWMALFASVAVILLTFAPAMIKRRVGVKIPLEFEFVATLFVYATLFLGEMHQYYLRFWWWDSLAHASYGITMGIVGFVVLYILWRKDAVQARPITIVFLSFCLAVAIGTLWEIVEFIIDQIAGSFMQKGLADTMEDLMLNTSGAFLASVMGYLYSKRQRGSIIERIIQKITHQ